MHPDGCSAVAVKPALDGEFLMFEHDFDEFELIFEFELKASRVRWTRLRKSSARGQHLAMECTSAGNPDGLVGADDWYLQIAELCARISLG